MTTKTPAGIIDCTPTWTSIYRLIITALQEGTPKGKAMATAELRRMAELADKAVAADKREPDFYSVDQDNGWHIGLFVKKSDAETAAREYNGGTITPLYKEEK